MHINIYVLTVLFSALIMTGLAFWSLRFRSVPGIRSFSMLNLSGAIYAFFYAFEVSSDTINSMWFFFRLEYFGISFFSAFFLLFALRFSGEVEKISKNGLITIFVIPVLTLISVFTNGRHGLFLTVKGISTTGPYPAFVFEPGIGYWIFQVFNIICILISLGVFIRMLWMAAPAYRKQYIILVASIAIPFPVYILYLVGAFPIGLDPLPYSYAVGGLIIAFGLTRFGLFRNFPVARNLLFDHIPDPVIVFDANLLVIDCNHAARKLFGISSKSFGKPALEIFTKFPEVSGYIQKKDSPAKTELTFDLHGNPLYYYVYQVPIQGIKQNNHGFMVIMQDITSQREAEILKSETEAKFRLIVENAPLGIFYFDELGIIQHCNEHFAGILGTEKEKIIGLGLLSIPNDKVRNTAANVMAGKKTFYEGEYQSLITGKHTHLKVVAIPVLNEKKEMIGGFAIVEDITEAQQDREKIHSKSKELIRLNAEKDRLFSIIAHDLKSPFFTLMGLSDILSDISKSTHNPEIISLTEDIKTSTHALNTLLDNLLEWTRLKRGLIQVENENFSPYNLANDIAALFEGHIKTKKLFFDNQIPENLILNKDRKMVSAIFRNLISNAIKYTNEDGFIQIKGQTTANNEYKFSVTDNGVGISPANLIKLFKIDQKIGTPGTNGEPSSGFGLLLCLEFAEQLEGYITAESEEGIGSTFSLHIPSPAS